MFDNIKGQARAIDILKNALNEDKLSHSYLFTGPDGVGKFTTALYFAMAINCLAASEKRPCGVCSSCMKMRSFNHPDLVYVFPTPNYDISAEGEIKDNKNLEEYESYLENKKQTPWKSFFFTKNSEIRMDCIRLLQHRINLSANEARYKVIIIEKADRLNQNAANAFLKTLEEPPDDVVIILTSSKYESLLPTIISRCQRVNFHKIPRKIIEDELFYHHSEDQAMLKMISGIADGNMEKALNTLYSQQSESREKMKQFIDLILQRDDINFIIFADDYKTSKTVSHLKEIIQYLIVWLGDVSFCKECPDEVVNIDLLEELHSIVDNNSVIVEHTPDLIIFLEEMLKRLDGNVSPHLVTIEIYNRFKRALS